MRAVREMEIPWSSKLGVEGRLLMRKELCLSKCSGQFQRSYESQRSEVLETRKYASSERWKPFSLRNLDDAETLADDRRS